MNAVAALAEARLLGEQAHKAGAEETGPWVEALGARKQAAALAAGAGDAPLRREADLLVAARHRPARGGNGSEAAGRP